MADASFTKLIAEVRDSPFPSGIKRDLGELVCLHRLGMDSIPLKEVPMLSPFIGVGIRKTYDFRASAGTCIECGEKNNAVICRACVSTRAKRLGGLNICGYALIVETMCKGEVRGGYCKRHAAMADIPF